MSVIACSSDDSTDGDGNIKPDVNVNDPAGTVSLSMMKGPSISEGATRIGGSYIYIGNDYNFDGGSFISLGTVKGLGNVSYIPTTGWADKVSVRNNNGYVAYSHGTFYRIFVEKEIVGTTGGIIGYDVKYQAPFKGKDLELELPATSVSFDKNGGTENIVFNNKEFVVFTAKSSENWCQIIPTSTYNYSFLSNGIQIEVYPSDVTATTEATITLTTAYGKKKEIKVTRGGVDPYLTLNETSVTLDAKECKRQIGLNTNIQKEDLTISNTASSWCKAEFVDQTRAIHASAARIKFVGNKPAKAVKAANAAGSASYYALVLKANSNDKDTERKGTITLKSKDGKKSVTLNVIQDKAYLYVKDKGYNKASFDNEERNATIGTVYTSLEYEDLQVSCNEAWCKPELQKTYGNIELNANISKNTTEKSREAKIVISNKTKTLSFTLTVSQRGIQFIPSQTKVGFDKNQSNKTITINTNSDWEASSNQSWCTISKNGNNLTIRATPYSGSAANRKATISFKGLSTKIEVDQSKYALGDEYNENGVKGQVICINDTIRYVGKDVGNAVWSNEDVLTGANNGYDGRVNMAIIKKISGWKDLYPAFALCDALNTGNVTGWYLPAREELFYIRKGGSGNKAYYWSSTEFTAKQAYTFYNDPYIQHKSSGYKVKAVHRF
ncbi:DUF5036 family protein [Prevotella pectinovora]|uniref:DUF5036 family protein n=1 Tax=Prevotella pectinovora TaxID=1602169 RepID=UPI003078EDFA